MSSAGEKVWDGGFSGGGPLSLAPRVQEPEPDCELLSSLASACMLLGKTACSIAHAEAGASIAAEGAAAAARPTR